jgi:hypothetical protein
MPKPLLGSEHDSDVAIIPIQMVTLPYVERALSQRARDRLCGLYADHMYTPSTISTPHDVSPREYTFWVGKGLNIGGIDFDESTVGGPAENPEQWCPGVIQWDSGAHGTGCGWLSVSVGERHPCSLTSSGPRILAVRSSLRPARW